jgi:hypothetical protein
MPKSDGREATKSLNKTITDVMAHLNDNGWRPGRDDGGYRQFLYEKIRFLAERSYKKGFNRGHRVSYAECVETGSVPTTLNYESKKKKKLSPGKAKHIWAKSKIKES